MNKADVVERIVRDASLSREQATEAIESFIALVHDAMKSGQRLTLVGFGSFTVTSYKGRNARNPRTGALMKLPPRRSPRFIPGASLRQAVQKGK